MEFKISGKQYFPENLKLAYITPVLKKNPSTLAEKYRSVLYCLLFLKCLNE